METSAETAFHSNPRKIPMRMPVFPKYRQHEPLQRMSNNILPSVTFEPETFGVGAFDRSKDLKNPRRQLTGRIPDWHSPYRNPRAIRRHDFLSVQSLQARMKFPAWGTRSHAIAEQSSDSEHPTPPDHAEELLHSWMHSGAASPQGGK